MGEQFVAGSRRVTGNDESDVLDRREERVALELHRAVATKLLENPSAVLSVVPSNIERLRRVVRGAAAESWLDEWANLADQRRVGALIDVMLGTDRRSVDMRQTSPFLGVLTKDERVAAISRAAA
jgi:predicted ABC-class ATPase